jgi:hypothetical protein
MERAFITNNARERERLKSLVSRLTDAQLSLPIDNTWTIAVALAHLAFWDQRCLSLTRKWKSSGVSPSPIDIDVTRVPAALWKALALGLPPTWPVSSAEAVDRELEKAGLDFARAWENGFACIALNTASCILMKLRKH